MDIQIIVSFFVFFWFKVFPLELKRKSIVTAEILLYHSPTVHKFTKGRFTLPQEVEEELVE